MFPDGFWKESTVIVAALTFAEVAVLVVTSTAYLFATRRSSRTPAAARRPLESGPSGVAGVTDGAPEI